MTTVDLIRSKEVLREIKEVISFFAEAQKFLHKLFICNLENYLDEILIVYKKTNEICDYLISIDFKKDKVYILVLIKFSEEEPFIPVYEESFKVKINI